MSPDPYPSDVLIARYIAGECSAEEARELEHRIARSPDVRRRVEAIRALLGPNSSPAKWDADRLWAEQLARAKPAPRVRRIPQMFRRESIGVRAAAAAASVLVFAAGTMLYVKSRSTPVGLPPVAEQAGRYSTTRGQYATVQLTDGSHVTLAPQSRLTIPAAFDRGQRDVSLEGEAIFDVKHDGAHPFRVHANGAQVEDIGTRFDLRAYQSDASVTVAVAEGSVALGHDPAASTGRARSGAEGVVLKSGQVGSLDHAGVVSAARSGRVTSILGWSRGTLSFVGRPLPEVLRDIGRWYDLDIRVSDRQLSTRLVTADFSTQSAAEMIDALALAVNATVERTGRIVTLRPR
jgi:transmembrane sensor